MTNMDNAQEVFATKVDAFATTLDPEEQAMLIKLLVGDDEVSGFGTAWPGIRSLLDDAGVGNSVWTDMRPYKPAVPGIAAVETAIP